MYLEPISYWVTPQKEPFSLKTSRKSTHMKYEATLLTFNPTDLKQCPLFENCGDEFPQNGLFQWVSLWITSKSCWGLRHMELKKKVSGWIEWVQSTHVKWTRTLFCSQHIDPLSLLQHIFWKCLILVYSFRILF